MSPAALWIAVLWHVVASLEDPPASNAWSCGTDLTECMVCSASYAWSGGGFARCRWCPKSKTCYDYGSYSNPCTYQEQITDPNQCPMDPDDPSEYNPELAREMLHYSSIGYCPPQSVRDWSFLNESCTKVTQGFVVDAVIEGKVASAWNNSFAYVGHDDSRKRIVVGFKGSNTTSDLWRIDFLVALNTTTSYDFQCQLFAPDAAIVITHAGFCAYYQSLNNGSATGGSLQDAILSAHSQHKDYEVWFTGHSLGGAVAALQAVSFALSTGVSPHLLTFGQPRTGDVSFGELVDRLMKPGASVRITHGRDIVPHVAPCCWNSESDTAACRRDAKCPVHHSREVWYPDQMSAADARHRVCSGQDGEDPECSDGLTLTDSLQDHSWYFGSSVGSMCCYSSAGTADGPLPRAPPSTMEISV